MNTNRSLLSRKRIQPNFLGPSSQEDVKTPSATTEITSSVLVPADAITTSPPTTTSSTTSASSSSSTPPSQPITTSQVTNPLNVEKQQPGIPPPTTGTSNQIPPTPQPSIPIQQHQQQQKQYEIAQEKKRQQSLELLQAVRERITDNKTYTDFIGLLQAFHTKTCTPEYVVENLRILLKGHQDLIEKFDEIVKPEQPEVQPLTTNNSTSNSIAASTPSPDSSTLSSTITKPPPTLPLPPSVSTNSITIVATPSPTSLLPKTDELLSKSVIDNPEIPDLSTTTTPVSELKRQHTDETLYKMLNKLEIRHHSKEEQDIPSPPLTTDDLVSNEGSNQETKTQSQSDSDASGDYDDEEDEEDEEEEGNQQLKNFTTGYQLEDEVVLSDDEVEDDPDPVNFHPDDLNDQKKMTEIHELIRQRNTRQRYQREQKLNEMFDRITNGAPPPYITPTKFEKRRKKKIGEDDSDDSDTNVNDPTNLLSLYPLASISEHPSDMLSNSTTSTLYDSTSSTSSSTSFATPRKSEKRKDHPPPSPFAPAQQPSQASSLQSSKGSAAEPIIFKKLFTNSNSIHKKMREKLTAVAILNSKELLKHGPNINMILIALMRLSLFVPSINEQIPKGAEGDKFQQLLKSENGLSNQFLKWKAAEVVKSYQNVTTDQWLSATSHTKKKLVGVHLMNQIIEILFGVANSKILVALADIPPIFTGQAAGLETFQKIVDALTAQKKLETPEEIQLFKVALFKVYNLLLVPPPPNYLLMRFESQEIQSIINNRSELVGKLKSIVKNHDPPKQQQQQPQQSLPTPAPTTQNPTIQPQQQPSQPVNINTTSTVAPIPTSTTTTSTTTTIQQPIQLPTPTIQQQNPTNNSQQTQQQQPPLQGATSTTVQSLPLPTLNQIPTPTIQQQNPTNNSQQTQQQQQQPQQQTKKSTSSAPTSTTQIVNIQEFMQSTQKNLQEMPSDQARIQYLLSLVSKQQAQLQQSQNENQRLTVQNQALYDNLDRYVGWHRNIKTHYEQYASFMSHSMMFSLQKK